MLLVFLAAGSLICTLITSRHERKDLYIRPIDLPILNPLMGLAPWANRDDILQPHTLVYADLSWRDFEPKEGVYDFDSFEAVNQISRWRREGKRVVFRFVTDFPGDELHLDIPDWLFKKTGEDGAFYENEYGKGFIPNYSNREFMRYHRLAIQALGDRYGGDGFFAFIELGSLGHWGEWHTYNMQLFPSEHIRNIYVFDYVEAFPKTHLLMRRPFPIARDLNLGLYNDMTGSFQETIEWLDWINNGGDFYLPDGKDILGPMPDGWILAPVGGEQAPMVDDEEMYNTNLSTTLSLLRYSHTSFIGPGGPYDIPPGGSMQRGIDEVLSVIGYRIYISRFESPAIVRFESSVELRIDFSNAGIAPFYYPWNVNLYLFDESGQIINAYLLPFDIRKVIPSQTSSLYFTLPVDELKEGRYTLGVAIIDPLTGAPGIELANVSERDDLIQEIGSFQVDWLFNFLGAR